MNPEEPLNNAFSVDPYRSVGLEDVGGGDYRMTVALGTGGVVTYLLHSPSKSEGLKSDTIPATPEHEDCGPLHPDYRERINRVVGHRCGRPTRAGGVCQTKVVDTGQACRWHPDAEATA